MTDTALLLAAVRNNAEWCGAVCNARGGAPRFEGDLWMCHGPTPRYYPNVITLAPSVDAFGDDLRAAVDRVRNSVGSSTSVKDSFADLDLAPAGLHVLFDATWIARDSEAGAATDSAGLLKWSTVHTRRELDEWQVAWDPEVGTIDPPFEPSLLDDGDIVFLALRRGARVVAGAIANRHAGVVGLSNVFAPPSDERQCWLGLIAYLMRWAPGHTLVGYERGAELSLALEIGFRKLGPLRVWIAD